MSLSDSVDRYGRISRFLHWAMAVLILWQFLSAGAHFLLEDTAIDKFLWPSHKPLGFLLFSLMILRTVWAIANLSRRPASLNMAARLGHIALYVLLFLVPALALLRQYGSGRAFEPFGIPLISGFEAEKIEWMVEPGNLLHGLLGWALLVLILGHIFMAFWHRRKGGTENVMPRMWR